nr:hypothetical protein L203_00925 [Cryptococcus depauperatus CBS 7841]
MVKTLLLENSVIKEGFIEVFAETPKSSMTIFDELTTEILQLDQKLVMALNTSSVSWNMRMFNSILPALSNCLCCIKAIVDLFGFDVDHDRLPFPLLFIGLNQSHPSDQVDR